MDLIIEISDSSLSLDRNEKTSLYAKGGITDYWLLNLKHHRLEVRRYPWAREDAAYGWDFATVRLYSPGQQVSPLFAPKILFDVSDLLGPRPA